MAELHKARADPETASARKADDQIGRGRSEAAKVADAINAEGLARAWLFSDLD